METGKQSPVESIEGSVRQGGGRESNLDRSVLDVAMKQLVFVRVGIIRP